MTGQREQTRRDAERGLPPSTDHQDTCPVEHQLRKEFGY